MNITGDNSIKNNIFDGSYQITILPTPTGTAYSFWSGKILNPVGITGNLVYLSDDKRDSGYLFSGYSYSGDSFPFPKGIFLSGATSEATSVSGYLYYSLNTPLLGVCHGVGNTGENMWYDGYNFYNAFHPEGTFSPPFGQNISVYKSNSNGTAALSQNGNCSSLTSQEYNDFFGIVSKADINAEASAEGISNGGTSFINSPAYACPQDIITTYYWRESQYNIIGGTVGAITANTFFNTNPIPTSLDNFDRKTALRYSVSGEQGGTLPNGQQETIQHILYDDSGKPIPAYQTVGANILNTILCPSITAESSLSIGTQTESQLLLAADVLSNPSKGVFDYFNWWNLWHFLYKENTDGFPFQNDYGLFQGEGVVVPAGKSSNYGSQLFEAQISNEVNYWDRRQCPMGINFLPHTFGGTIYACPSYTFEIPYYAATKKFGFYGARFLDGCLSLDLGDAINDVPNSSDLPPNATYTIPEEEEPDPDVGTLSSNSRYDNLLDIANKEELHSDFYAMNKGLFLWANSGLINLSPDFVSLNSVTGFPQLYSGLLSQYSAVFSGGKSGMLENDYLYISGEESQFYDTGIYSLILSQNSNYRDFKNKLSDILSGPLQISYWNNIEKDYSYTILSQKNQVDNSFYNALQTGKQSRLFTRYLENYVKGNSVDLYPTNKIYFSYDSASSYIESSGWGKSPNSFGTASHFDPNIARRYFLGAYTNGQDVLGVANFSQNSAGINLSNYSFYPGYFNGNVGLELPPPSFLPVLSGVYDSTGDPNFNNESIQGNDFPTVTNGWNLVGYNGIGKLNLNFSCFTPIFVQNPLPITHCKIGQAPTFRAYAVDYHTIPEDKMNNRNPEIRYWMDKLKISNGNESSTAKTTNAYPLSYKWYRIKKIDCTGSVSETNINDGDFKKFLLNPNFSKVVPSSQSGDWCCLEGDDQYCTLIHPTGCIPPSTSPMSILKYKYANYPGQQTARQNNYNMTFVKGAQKNEDEDYYYFCMARGRFGIRISEPSQLFIEDWIDFDISIRNGGNNAFEQSKALTVSLDAGDLTIDCNASSVPSYAGFVQDTDAIPEDVVEEQIPPPNRGYGDVFSYKFVGPWGYRGAVQSYTPGTLKDTRGLKETWGRLLHYGSLFHYHRALSQTEGDALYGRNHLPVCNSSHEMSDKQKGIKVTVNGIVHWANMQNPIADTKGSYGVKWSKLGNAAELYNPSSSLVNGGIDTSASPGLGQWQYGNNFGTIHNFGWNSNLLNPGTTLTAANIENGDLTTTPGSLSTTDFQKLKTNVLSGGVLAGKNCGWHKGGLGRATSFWIEGFSSFYLFCDPLKKKNVTNYNYMSPGLRQSNSSIQYFWLGKPNNSYLERYPMFGPYAYQWRVRRHNRDRNGNGISEGFYSYGWGSNYSLMYDNPAIYGLFTKYKSKNQSVLADINSSRISTFGSADAALNVSRTRFGFTNGDGGAKPYGTVWIGNISDPTPNTARDYVNKGYANALSPEFSLYGCSDADIDAGNCFDPCISMRYQNGFLPGGKRQDLFTANNSYRIIANNPVVNNVTGSSTVVLSEGTSFRGPFGAPHIKYLSSLGTKVNGFSPCFDGGADHCNYITPTINIGASTYYEGRGLTMINTAMSVSQSLNF